MTDPYVPMDRKKILKDTAVAGNVATTLTVPAGERWLILNAKIALTTDATVASRVPRIRKQDTADFSISSVPGLSQAASLGPTTSYFMREVSVISTYTNALGFQLLDAGEDFYIYIVNGQAGDSYDYAVEYLKVEI